MKSAKNKKSTHKAKPKIPAKIASPRDVNPDEREDRNSKKPDYDKASMEAKSWTQARR